MTDLRRKGVAAALSLVVLLLLFDPCFDRRGGSMDEGALLVYPELVQKGAVPYRDFETFYGPANPWLLSAVYSIFGTTITVERVTGLLYRVLILLAIFCITQRWGVAVASACTLLTGYLLIATGIIAYAWVAAMVCALWYIWLSTAQVLSQWRCLTAGFIAGLTLLFRIDAGPGILLATLPLWFSLSWPQRRMLCLGVMIALLPLVLLTIVVGPEEIVNNLFLYPVLRSSPGRHWPLSSVEPSVVRLFFVHLVVVVVNLIVGFVMARGKTSDRRNLALLSTSLLAAGITHQAWQRLDLFHLLCAAFLSIGILPLSLMIIASKCRPPLFTSKRVSIGAAIAITLVVGMIAPEIPLTVGMAFTTQTMRSRNGWIERNGRSFPIGSKEVAAAIERILDTLDHLSLPGQRIFVGPGDLRRTNYCDTYIYHLVPKLRPATYFLEMNPFSANRPHSRITADLESADWVVLNRTWDDCERANRSCESGSNAPNQALLDNFALVAWSAPYGLFRHKPQNDSTTSSGSTGPVATLAALRSK